MNEQKKRTCEMAICPLFTDYIAINNSKYRIGTDYFFELPSHIEFYAVSQYLNVICRCYFCMSPFIFRFFFVFIE